MYTIVAGIDTDTKRAEAIGGTIAAMPLDGARVVLVHVFDENPEGAGVGQVGAVNHARTILEESGQFEISMVGKSGSPAPGILESAEEHDADVICVAGRKRTPTGKAVFGSVTQDVILDTRYPVLVCDTE